MTEQGRGGPDDIERFHALVIDHMAAPILAPLKDPDVSEVMINGPDEIYIESNGQITRFDGAFAGPDSLEALARSILQYSGKRLDPSVASIEGRLPDRSRVHILLPPAARNGLCIAIRKFKQVKLGLDDLISRGSLTKPAARLLSLAVQRKRNIVISGGTGSGKTTLLNVLSQQIDPAERILVIEDASEIQIPDDRHVVQLEATPPDRFGRGGISIGALFRASLRMRPDRIIIGECRGGEALDMAQAMNSGHSGSMSTVHANSPADALSRLETLCMTSGVNLPLFAVRAQLGAAINLIVQIERRGSVRLVSSITEVLGFDDQIYRRSEVFTLPESTDPQGTESAQLRWTGCTPSFAPQAAGWLEPSR